MELIIVTGMSGAGKSQTVNALEDSGYCCVDNLPVDFLCEFCRTRSNDSHTGTAIVVDARSGALPQLETHLARLRADGIQYKLLFLDASSEALLQRYKETRRRHPLLDAAGDLPGAIRLEREQLQTVRESADYVIDTSLLSPTQLRRKIWETFCDENRGPIAIQCLSFGFRYGLPPDADLVFDVRCLPNPFYLPELRPYSGADACVRDYIMQFPESRELLDRLCSLLEFLLPMYIAEGKSQLVIATGCTGGRHRSVTFAQEIGARLGAMDYKVAVGHRDKDKVVQK